MDAMKSGPGELLGARRQRPVAAPMLAAAPDFCPPALPPQARAPPTGLRLNRRAPGSRQVSASAVRRAIAAHCPPSVPRCALPPRIPQPTPRPCCTPKPQARRAPAASPRRATSRPTAAAAAAAAATTAAAAATSRMLRTTARVGWARLQGGWAFFSLRQLGEPRVAKCRQRQRRRGR